MQGYKRKTRRGSKWDLLIGLVIVLMFSGSCAPTPTVLGVTPVPVTASNTAHVPAQTLAPIQAELPTKTQEVVDMPEVIAADVLAVEVTGQPNAYQFNVQVSSPDSGCNQYADWWEVLSEDGQLLYRRVLLHSHVSEQPFSRSGGPVAVNEDVVIIVRAHMNTGGYGGAALRGSASSGFETVNLEAGFAADVESLPPLPEDCAF